MIAIFTLTMVDGVTWEINQEEINVFVNAVHYVVYRDGAMRKWFDTYYEALGWLIEHSGANDVKQIK